LNTLTPTQLQAVTARGNVLVVAGAGTGKTHTLVERCCRLLLEEDCRLDEILMVTFTEAAAAEMRDRIRGRLLEQLAEQPDHRLLEEQLALLDTAHISTLHGFCLQLVREHFHELGLDPQLTVLAEEQVHQVSHQTLDALLAEHYAGTTDFSQAVQRLIEKTAHGSDRRVRELIWRLHRYAQSLPAPHRWLEEQRALFADGEPARWREWLAEGLAQWRAQWQPELERFDDTPNVLACIEALKALPAAPTIEQAGNWLGQIQQAHAAKWPRGAAGKVRDQLEEFFDDAAFLASLVREDGSGGDRQEACPALEPLAEDWEWVRGHMATLVELAREFGERFAAAKRELAGVDFADLEQFALRLLREEKTGAPTPLAEHWRRRLRFVFVDEYQDINAAQDAILRALSREDAEANRFLVGDVKQSIYRFRLANPHIFQTYKQSWQNSAAGRTIPLSDNFRSREALLDFVNALFAVLMRESIGGVGYEAEAHLRFGAPAGRPSLGRAADAAPRVEVHLVLKHSGTNADQGASDTAGAPLAAGELAELETAEREARLVAQRLHALHETRHQVWDKDDNRFRDVRWRDMVVLLRAPANKVESFAKEFSRAGVPLVAERGGFYDATEISDLLSLLHLLDNPLQDIPLLAVLRSPLVGLTLDELVAVRLAKREGYCWTALRKFHREFESLTEKPILSSTGSQPVPSGDLPDESSPASRGPGAAGCVTPPGAVPVGRLPTGAGRLTAPPLVQTRPESGGAGPGETLRTIVQSAWPKVDAFLASYDEWRRAARQTALSELLERVVDETHYSALVLAQTRGEQRLANLRRLLSLTRRFDPWQREGLGRFLKFMEAQQEAEAKEPPAPLPTQDAVRLLSIHQSKGLELPVVVLADLGKAFNFSDLRTEVLLDERYGLCPRVTPPHLEAHYPSLPYWLAQRRQRRESLGEELRLLYVALTRARDTLLLVGTTSEKAMHDAWPALGDPAGWSEARRGRARSWLDWVGPWLVSRVGAESWSEQTEGETELFRWRIHAGGTSDFGFQMRDSAGQAEQVELAEPVAAAVLERLRARLSWQYPNGAATREAAKASVSILRRRLADETDDEAQRWLQTPTPRTGLPTRIRSRPTRLSPAEIGTAHHLFQECVALECTGSVAELRAEAARLEAAGLLAPEEVAALDFAALAAFWQSELGRRIRAEPPGRVQRELPFTARLSPADLATVGLPTAVPVEADEFLVVQGVADLAVLRPRDLWLVDFKTDQVRAAELDAKCHVYGPQLRLYGLALGRIYGRPVTGLWLHFLALSRSVSVPRT
jgi:ATP-dependent helicase/nuclease subunit A